jgi:hypothetical protein
MSQVTNKPPVLHASQVYVTGNYVLPPNTYNFVYVNQPTNISITLPSLALSLDGYVLRVFNIGAGDATLYLDDGVTVVTVVNDYSNRELIANKTIPSSPMWSLLEVTADSFRTNSSAVDVSSTIEPVAGQVLVAVGASDADWQFVAAGLGIGSFYGNSPADYPSPIGVGAAVPFPHTAVTAGSVGPVDSMTFNLPVQGTYKVTFVVNVSDAGQLSIFLNGVQAPNTTFGKSVTGGQITGCAFVITNFPNTNLQIVNWQSGTPLTITGFSGGFQQTTQTLTIERLM